MASIMKMSEQERGDNDTVDSDGGVLSAIGYEFDTTSFSYTTRDVILYALGGKCSHFQMASTLYCLFQLVPLCHQTISQN